MSRAMQKIKIVCPSADRKYSADQNPQTDASATHSGVTAVSKNIYYL